MNTKTERIQLIASIISYIACLFFSGFYIRTAQQPYGGASLYLLAIGWLGILGGHFSWFANPLYFLAIFIRRKRNGLSFVLSFFSLLLALSFLFHSRIITDEGGGTGAITAYGFGYFLWVASILLLIFSNLNGFITNKTKLSLSKIKLILTFQYALLILSTTIFFFHYFFSDSSHYKIVRDREQFFEQNCSKAVETIYKKASNVHGVFYGPGTRNAPGCGMGLGYINSGLLEFYETENQNNSNTPYLRFRRGEHRGEEVSEIKSEYSLKSQVLTQHLRDELAIYGATISVIENNTGNTIATKTFFKSHARNDVNDKMCGSYSTFLSDVLSLTKRFPSNYDE
jgi:hypothetical protein